MKFFVISGAPSTGKTTVINNISQWLTSGIITTDSNGDLLPSFLPDAYGNFYDFSIVIIIRGRKIIVHSASDDTNKMDALIEKIKQNPDTEIVITSCRDIYWERDYFTENLKPYSTFFLESPLGKITRRNDFDPADNLYKNILLEMHQHILPNNPYNL
jgi:uncharacterized protein YlzI (FlbEa/FlbD family)